MVSVGREGFKYQVCFIKKSERVAIKQQNSWYCNRFARLPPVNSSWLRGCSTNFGSLSSPWSFFLQSHCRNNYSKHVSIPSHWNPSSQSTSDMITVQVCVGIAFRPRRRPVIIWIRKFLDFFTGRFSPRFFGRKAFFQTSTLYLVDIHLATFALHLSTR